MSLIKCKECGKEISNKARKCPNCGYSNNEKKVKYICSSIMLIIIIIIIVIILKGYNKNNKNSYSSYSSYNPSASTSSVESSSLNLFKNLEIKTTNKTTSSEGWYKVVGTTKNNNNVAINGYFTACFYSSSGVLLDTKTVSLDTIEAKGTGSWSVYIRKDVNYSKIEFQDSIIRKAK